MSNYDQNRLRAFASVVSVDVWHPPFKPERREVDLKADVFFSEARVGGEVESQVEFRLRLKRAVLTLIKPETEPVEVIRESINRGQATEAATWTEETVKKVEGGVGASLAASFKDGKIAGSGDINAKANVETSKIRKEKQSGTQQEIRTTFVYDNIDDSFTWVIECDAANFLSGRAFSGADLPLLRLRDTRVDSGRGIAPNVRIGIKCLREDLIISDIKMKEGVPLKQKIRGNQGKIKLRAAEAYIRTKLCEIGLEVGDLGSDFSKLILLDVSAKVQE